MLSDVGVFLLRIAELMFFILTLVFEGTTGVCSSPYDQSPSHHLSCASLYGYDRLKQCGIFVMCLLSINKSINTGVILLEKYICFAM